MVDASTSAYVYVYVSVLGIAAIGINEGDDGGVYAGGIDYRRLDVVGETLLPRPQQITLATAHLQFFGGGDSEKEMDGGGTSSKGNPIHFFFNKNQYFSAEAHCS